jgi:drug/metabolite transporter (DMT)-like permease
MVMPTYILPQAFILMRVCITVVLFFGVGRFWGNEPVDRRDMPMLFICGLFGVLINQELFFAGLNITTPINAALLMIMTPILVMVISIFKNQESITWQKSLGLALGCIGAFLIISGRGFSFSSATALGDFFILLNAASYAIYLVIVKPLMHRYHPLTVIKWVFLFGAPFTVLFGWEQLVAIQWHQFTGIVWSAVFFVVFCTTFCAYLFNVVALRELHSSIVGAYIYLQPVLATLIAILLGRDLLSPTKVIAAIFIFTGVYLVSFAGRKPSTID